MNKRIISLLLASVLAVSPLYTNIYAEETGQAVVEDEGAVSEISDESVGEIIDEETASEEDIEAPGQEEDALTDGQDPKQYDQGEVPDGQNEDVETQDASGSKDALSSEDTAIDNEAEDETLVEDPEGTDAIRDPQETSDGAVRTDEGVQDAEPEAGMVEEPDMTVSAKQEEISYPTFDHTEEIDGYTISLSADKGVLPEKTVVKIERISQTDTEEIKEIVDEKIPEGRKILDIVVFDISFYLNDEKIEPEEGNVKVSISLSSDMEKVLKEAGDEPVVPEVYHITETDDEADPDKEPVADIDSKTPESDINPGKEEKTQVDRVGNAADKEENSAQRATPVESRFTDEKEVEFEAADFSPYAIVLTTTNVGSYTIRFNGNGSTSGAMGDMTCNIGTQYNLIGNAFSRQGYTFKNWNTKADGTGTAYADRAQITDLSTKTGDIVTLYACWDRTVYTISYELNGGKNNASNPSSYTIATKTIKLSNPTRKGCDFEGWFSDSNYKTKVTQIKKGSTGDRTFYAKWKAHKYTIRFNGNGATKGSMKDQKGCKYGKTYTLKANSFKKTGYKFVGWTTKKNGKGKVYSNKAQVENLSSKDGGVVTLYAKWKKVKYQVTYELNGGKNNSSNPASYTVTSSTIKIKDPSKKGYTFGGWFSDSKFKKKATQIKKGSTGNKTFYAKWTANKYTVRFNGNGATSGSMKDMTGRKYASSFNLTANAFKKTGTTFAGWNTKADGSGTAYADKAKVSKLSAKNGGVVTLYAQWAVGSYKIQFSGNGSDTGSMAVITCKIGQNCTLPQNSFARSSFRFDGWNTRADGKGAYYVNGATVKNLTSNNGATVTLYAQWEEDFTRIPLGYSSPSQSEIKSFIKNHPLTFDRENGLNTYKRKPSLKEPYSAGQLSDDALKSSLNALNTYRYIVGLPANVRLNSTYSDLAAKATLINCLNNDFLSHYPERPTQLSAAKYDSLYNDGYKGASHSNLAYRGGSWYQAMEEAVDSWMHDTDAGNISAVGHRRWLLDPNLTEVGFGQTVIDDSNYSHRSYNAVYVNDDTYYPNSNKSVAWPAVNTPVTYFLADPFRGAPAWSFSVGRPIDIDMVKVRIKSAADKKVWNFSSTSADGYFNVNNNCIGDPGCVIFMPEGLTIKSGATYNVTVTFYDTAEMTSYDVHFF